MKSSRSKKGVPFLAKTGVSDMRQSEPCDALTAAAQELFALDLSDRFIHVVFVQALYYLGTGIWPLVSISTFQLVTGPKTDLWLVKTVGVLITVIGIALLIASYRRRTTLEVRLIAIGSALGLTAIDVIYVSLGRIAPIYLLDTVVELALVVWWCILWQRKPLPHHSAGTVHIPQIYEHTVRRSY